MRIGVTSVEWTWLGLEWHLDLEDVDDVAPPTVKLSDAKCHTSLLFSFLLENSLYFGVNEICKFKLVLLMLLYSLANMTSLCHSSY